MARLSVPTAARLSSSLRLSASSPLVQKLLSRLSRPSLLSLALDWLDEKNDALSFPFLQDEEGDDDDADDFYPPARSLDELQELYADLQARKGPRREIVDRILEGDWRNGLSLYQLAMADLQHLFDHPTAQKWSAYRIVALKPPSKDGEDETPEPDKESLRVPRFHPSTFLRNLQAQVLPDVKAHYNFERHKELPLLILRIFILESPYSTDLATSARGGDELAVNSDSSRTVYIGFPDASPHIYISKSETMGGSGTQPASVGETKSVRTLVLRGIPKALSRPRERYSLQTTRLSTRNLHELVHRRGAGRTNNAGGGWSIYADEKKKESPLDTVLPSPPLSEEQEEEEPGGETRPKARKRAMSPGAKRDERDAKRRRLQAQARFGDSGKPDNHLGIEQLDIVIGDAFRVRVSDERTREEEGEAEQADAAVQKRRSRGGRRSNVELVLDKEAQADEEAERPEDDERGQSWRPRVRMTFHGTHVFAGIRQLVECGIVDGERMPGWMTGEEGVTIGAVRHGRIRGIKGYGV